MWKAQWTDLISPLQYHTPKQVWGVCLYLIHSLMEHFILDNMMIAF